MGWKQWTGLGERRWKTAPDEQVQPPKTLWDWLQLLIVPAILVAVTFAWAGLQTSSDNRREDRRIAADRAAAEQARQDTTLNDYLRQMSDLMLNKKLLSSKPEDAVRSVSRTVTLTTLRRLDGERKGEVVRFLLEAGLIRPPFRSDVSVVDLHDADLKHADLTHDSLAEVNLAGANLTDANLTGSNLSGAHLDHANLTHADLTETGLGSADLEFANLTHADLTWANLPGADLYGANLAGAQLKNANFSRAKLKYANLTGARGFRLRSGVG